jgi:hypothetical protein
MVIMVKKMFFCFIFFCTVSIYSIPAVKLASFPDVLKPVMIAIDDGKLYISDQYSILSYSMADYKLLGKICAKGEGPGEFKTHPRMKILKKEILVYSSLKFSRFSKNGKLLMEKRVPPVMMLGNIFPVGNNYVISFWRFNRDGKHIRAINIVDKDFNKIKSLYHHINKRKYKNGKTIVRLINTGVNFQCEGDKIFLANSHKGFCIEIFDSNGNPIGVINKKFTKVRIPEEYKNKRLDDFLKTFSGNQKKRIAKTFEFDFPEYFPEMRGLSISNGKIYVNTHAAMENKVEYVILDFDGKLLKRVFLPESKYRHSTFYNDTYYFLKENESEELWELYSYPVLRN